jgi:outer membrane receptor for ferrienterochelin and colicin
MWIKAQNELSGWHQAFCLAASLILISPSAFAQDEIDEFEAEEEFLEEVAVTGTRIKRRDFSSPSPITTISDEEFEFSGRHTLEEYLDQVPQLHLSYGRTYFVSLSAEF